MKQYDWAAEYREKLTSAKEALEGVYHCQRVFIGSGCGEPQHLVTELKNRMKRLCDLEIIRLYPLHCSQADIASNASREESATGRFFYLGSAPAKDLIADRPFLTPLSLSTVSRLIKTHLIPIDVALLQMSPPDSSGMMSLGISVDITMTAARSARLVIAQVNTQMPRTYGQGFVHISNVNRIVEKDEMLLTFTPPCIHCRRRHSCSCGQTRSRWINHKYQPRTITQTYY
ncbi:MAG: hypothetical protein C4582_05125 [Desulfobacteraceae bacterium]|jgi:acyl-CoA hydrolase|nr:MAG: hypothetical protein C4582_05125 [Desulfobacteraceae bacterium]